MRQISHLKQLLEINTIFSLEMPFYFANFHWGLHPKNVNAITLKFRRKLERLMARFIGEQVPEIRKTREPT